MQGGFVSGFRGVYYLASMGLAILFWHMVNQSRAWMMSWCGGWSDSPGVSRSSARHRDTAYSSPVTARLVPALPSRLMAADPARGPSPANSTLQFWRAGEVFAGASYEQMRQLRSLSLRHYVLWRGKNKSLLKACKNFIKHLFREIWPMWYTHYVIVVVCAGPCMMSVSLRCLWLGPCFRRSWSRLHTTGIQLPRLFPTLI